MRKLPFRRTVAVAVLFSLVFWTAGCTSYQAVEDWRDLTESSIRVMTKDGSVYQLERWRVDSLGTVSGKGTVEVPWQWPADFDGKIPADSISRVKADREDWREHPEPPIRVTMKDGTEYLLEHWRVDSLGMVSGNGTVARPWNEPMTFEGTFPASNVAAVQNASDFYARLIVGTVLLVGSLYLLRTALQIPHYSL